MSDESISRPPPQDHSRDDNTGAGTPHSHPNKSLWHTRPLLVIAAIAALIGIVIFANTSSIRQPLQQSATATSLKTVIRGLTDRGRQPSSAWTGHIDGWVVNAKWADLQTSAGAPIAANNVIDKAIAAARKATGLSLKVRVFAGDSAPAWAKSIGGAPFTMKDIHSGASGTVGRWWLPAFGTAWNDFETKLAAKYDSVPEIRETTMSRCTSIYAEPMIRQISDPASVKGLLTAGYTVAQDQTCQEAAVDAMQPWVYTHSDLTFNPYQVINQNGSTGTDETFTETVMNYCRSALGSRCVLENNSIRSTSLGGGYNTMYAAMKSLAAPISFQTATIARVGSLSGTLTFAAQEGASSVEMPSGYESSAPTTYDKQRAALVNNPTPSPTPTPTPTPTATPTATPTPTPTATSTPTLRLAAVAPVQRSSPAVRVLHRVTPRPAPPPPVVVSATTQIALINADRARSGLVPYLTSGCLLASARTSAARMAAQGYMSDGGYAANLACGLGTGLIGENVGWDTTGVQDGWINAFFMNSPPHRANILGHFRYIGTAWALGTGGTAYVAIEFA